MLAIIEIQSLEKVTIPKRGKEGADGETRTTGLVVEP